LNAKKQIGKNVNFTPKKAKTFDHNFAKAVKYKTNKDFDNALKFYMLAFENNEKRESCIKDIGMLYVQMQEPQKALDFIIEHEYELPDDIVSYNYLVNFYSSIKKFDKVVEYYDKLLGKTNNKTNNITTSLYQTNKAFALIKMNQEQKAKEVLNRAIKNNPNNDSAIRLLQALNEQNDEEKSQIISFEIDAFGGGLSTLIKNTIDNYQDYYGLKAKVIDSGKFTLETLNDIRKLIDTAGAARPRESANYLLTEAKLMTTLEPEKENDLRSVLARYCNAMATNHITENSSMDIIRSYYLEAFSLEERYDANVRQVVMYMMSYISQYSELLKLQSTKVPIENLLTKTLSVYRNTIWEGLLAMFVWNRNISAQLINIIYDNQKYKSSSIQFLESQNLSDSHIANKIDVYVKIWNIAIDKRRRDYAKWFAALKAIYNTNNLDTAVSLFPDSVLNLTVNWLPQLDLSRLTTISTDINDALNQYLKQTSYRDKERSYNFAKAQINQLIDDIKEKPTKFSYDGFMPLLEKVCMLLDASFKVVEQASTPKVTVKILGESSVVSVDGSVQIKISVENSKDSSPIRDIKLKINKSDGVDSPYTAEHADSVDGSEHCELQLKATLSDKVIKDKATTINVNCCYKIRSQEDAIELQTQLSLRLYSEDEFEAIPNPYEVLANGGPVLDTKMFYGRNEFIERITEAVIKTNSKQVVIYGQKRSGKSSVLYHLKKKLEATNQTFCITFSIGDIFNENLSAAQLFYKIISKIEEEIEFAGGNVPDFKCPTFKDFADEPNPADFFRKQIRLFKKACSLIDEWKNKKLVIMIDEFTYLYAAIKEDKIDSGFMKQWKAITQSEESAYSSVLVGQDVFPMFKDEFPNEFGVTQDERLTYLAKADAVRLIEEPMGEPKSGKRFIEDAVETIIDYTSCNPYYIQIFCARLVSEMNRKKYMQVTSADVKEIADSFINGGQALTDDKFDNLLNAGEKYDIQAISQETTKLVLKKIATNAQHIGYCLREQISIGDKEMEDKVLADLVKREVLEQKNDSYKIQVKLFQEWLLKH
jgi:tetratricopeptide (TPR) repeat protein